MPWHKFRAVWKSSNNDRFETPPDILSQLKRAWGTNIFITITEQYPKLRHRKTHNKNSHKHVINTYINIYRLQTNCQKKCKIRLNHPPRKAEKTYVYPNSVSLPCSKLRQSSHACESCFDLTPKQTLSDLLLGKPPWQNTFGCCVASTNWFGFGILDS